MCLISDYVFDHVTGHVVDHVIDHWSRDWFIMQIQTRHLIISYVPLRPYLITCWVFYGQFMGLVTDHVIEVCMVKGHVTSGVTIFVMDHIFMQRHTPRCGRAGSGYRAGKSICWNYKSTLLRKPWNLFAWGTIHKNRINLRTKSDSVKVFCRKSCV